MTYRVRNIVIAVALALVAGLLSIFYVSNYKANVQHAEKTVTVTEMTDLISFLKNWRYLDGTVPLGAGK